MFWIAPLSQTGNSPDTKCLAIRLSNQRWVETVGVEKPAFPRLPFVAFALFVLQLLDRQAVASVLKRVSPRILADGDRPPMRPGMSSLGRVSSLACFSYGGFQMLAILCGSCYGQELRDAAWRRWIRRRNGNVVS